MNFLAHIYLSGEDPEILMGNFIGDSIKGKKALEKFPLKVQNGIMMHREIDFFMDTHPIVKDGMGRLRENYPKFSGVIMDMFYDHFLAKNWQNYSSLGLEEYTHKIYQKVEDNKEFLTGKSKKMFPYMRSQNWLLAYQTVDGLESILRRMTKRIRNMVPLHESVNELQIHYEEYDQEFEKFFSEIMAHISDKHDIQMR